MRKKSGARVGEKGEPNLRYRRKIKCRNRNKTLKTHGAHNTAGQNIPTGGCERIFEKITAFKALFVIIQELHNENS